MHLTHQTWHAVLYLMGRVLLGFERQRCLFTACCAVAGAGVNVLRGPRVCAGLSLWQIDVHTSGLCR